MIKPIVVVFLPLEFDVALGGGCGGFENTGKVSGK